VTNPHPIQTDLQYKIQILPGSVTSLLTTQKHSTVTSDSDQLWQQHNCKHAPPHRNGDFSQYGWAKCSSLQQSFNDWKCSIVNCIPHAVVKKFFDSVDCLASRHLWGQVSCIGP